MSEEFFVVIGLGKTGFSCVRYLRQQHKKIAVMDTRSSPPYLEQFHQQFSDVPLFLGELNKTTLSQATSVVVSPGLSIHESAIVMAQQNGAEIIGDIELFARAVTHPVIAITGTNAKSTVTTLVGEIAKKAGKNALMGANLGLPALDMLNDKQANFFVTELSSFQLETTYSLRPRAATILNITPDHLDRYANLQEYAAAKQRIYIHAEAIVFNRDDPLTIPVNNSVAKRFSFGTSAPKNNNEFGIIVENDQYFLAQGSKKLLNTTLLKIYGQHNWLNALAALALIAASDLEVQAGVEVLQEFQGLPHRCQWVTQKNNITWYNDSKGTNISSSVAALQGLAQTCRGKIILIAGGQGKKQNFSDMRHAITQFTRTVILFGEDAKIIGAALEDTVPLQFVTDLKSAVEKAGKLAQAGDAILLSPACASFDMFNNYEHRGDVFMQLVREYYQ